MLTFLLQFTGWCLAHSPESFLRVFSVVIGEFIYVGIPRRRRLLLSNLSHAFPNRDARWIHHIGRQSCRRLVETGLLSLASPYLSDQRLRIIARLGPGADDMLRERIERPRPTVLASLHLAYWETQTWLGLLSPYSIGDFAVIYRPLDNPSTDQFIRKTRERFGMRLLSRKEGFAEALKTLRRNGIVGLLFDQNAGMQGALTTLFGRVCSSTELPGILAEKYKAEVRIIFPRRLAFWRIEAAIDLLPHDGTAEGVTVELNRWLEKKLSESEGLCASWLWSHNRWRNQDIPSNRLHLEAKRNLLTADLNRRGLNELPRKTRVFVRLPNWLGDVVMALPLLRALRTSRPDAHLTLVGKEQFKSIAVAAGVADAYEPLPQRGWTYWLHFYRLRKRFPDLYLLFTNSTRGDLEAFLTRTPQRFGIRRPGKARVGLTHVYTPPDSFDESASHQLVLWENYFRHFGLVGELDKTPLCTTAGTPIRRSADDRVIGLIAGSENTPAKRWPALHWKALIDGLPGCRFVLFGTGGDRRITTAIAGDLPEGRAENLAGSTDLSGFIERLKHCDLLVSNDTGGMHLGNAFGIPLIGLFGPTNPVRTRPVFDAPAVIMQPRGCPPTGGGDLSDLTPTEVIAQVRKILGQSDPGE